MTLGGNQESSLKLIPGDKGGKEKVNNKKLSQEKEVPGF